MNAHLQSKAKTLQQSSGVVPAGLKQRKSVAWDNRKGMRPRGPLVNYPASKAQSIMPEVSRSSGQPLDSAMRASFQPSFGHDFGRMRVRDEILAPESLNSVVKGQVRNQDAGTAAGAGAGAGTGSAGAGAGTTGAGAGTGAGTGAGGGAGGAGAAGAAGGGGGATGGGGPAAPVVTIGRVRFLNSNDRVAPTKTTTVNVNVSGLAAGGSIAMDVQGSGGANGTATITTGNSLTGSGTVTVRGGNQTDPGNAGNLRIRARSAGAVVGRSRGFTVAAWPANFTTSRIDDINAGGGIGVVAANAWVSDGGTLAQLNETERTERVDLRSRDNPPFTVVGAISAGTGVGTSGFIAGTASPTSDRHSYARANIDTAAVGAGTYTLVYGQNFLMNDRRTGVTNRVVRRSGFTITHRVVVAVAGGVTTATHRTVKRGAGGTVEGRATRAGSGTATSDNHAL